MDTSAGDGTDSAGRIASGAGAAPMATSAATSGPPTIPSAVETVSARDAAATGISPVISATGAGPGGAGSSGRAAVLGPAASPMPDAAGSATAATATAIGGS